MSRYLLGLLGAGLVGVGLPQLEIAFVCSRPGEGCGWWHASLPLNVAATSLLLGVPTFFVIVWLLGRRSKVE
jgi:hypothetical protein